MGLAMIAGEIHSVARMMDRLELKVRRLFSLLGRALAAWPAWMQLSVSLVVALVSFAFVYGLYSLAFTG